MQRQSKRKIVAILTGDIHLTEKQPPARTDDFQKAQWQKLDYLKKMQQYYECPVLHSGDLFDHWKPSPWLIAKAIQHLPNQLYTVYGNHDLPQHNLELADKTGINVLQKAGKISVLNGVHWGEAPGKDSAFVLNDITFLIWHVGTYQAKLPYPGCNDPKAAKLLRKYPKYDIILTGHYHNPFIEQYQGRTLINPGSLTRQASDQTHEPSIWFVYNDKSVERHILPYDNSVIQIPKDTEKKEKREQRIEAFITKLNSDWEGTLSFEENLQRFISTNKIPAEITNLISKYTEYE